MSDKKYVNDIIWWDNKGCYQHPTEPPCEYIYYDKDDENGSIVRHFIKSDNKNVIIWLSGRNDYFYHHHVIENFPDYNVLALDFFNCGYAIIPYWKHDTELPYDPKNPPYCITNFDSCFKTLDLLYQKYIIGKYTNVILYGFDLGGLIALSYYNHCKKVWFDKMILNNPFLNINSKIFNDFTLNYIYPMVVGFWGNHDINTETNETDKLTLKIKECGFNFDEKIKFLKQSPITLEFINEINKLQNKLKKSDKKINIPTLILTSDYKNDNLLSDLNINDFCKKNKIEPMLIKNSLHDVLVSNTLAKNLAIDAIKKFIL